MDWVLDEAIDCLSGFGLGEPLLTQHFPSSALDSWWRMGEGKDMVIGYEEGVFWDTVQENGAVKDPC